ncbi:MAG: hypothetical protein KUA35_09145 [Pseudodesulfovibrio sp.]|uniref:Uncharacterized protein n=1 Tax=Pseudodesulfovibrio aespoeensis (strain ATCC 700646 / DSM 10631 / Aspo-2) TaxID=643562 RepID=E6VXK8_PSEA9|nr:MULTISPECIES: hypothetical protein [Pseudodesulfovibrio]MBU4190804.1 hypothetical protein [Pseudomonadota bacterium]ADU61466.1 hypothetical protein Daes_0444 [Pseudodesulfovibrio aespoeensis Aspo-2]MBU4380367.1 hypothetical protein [Pseudomonadota bacterium]MBU4475235.1 hypothetical protein [Pseudomonadota bacterium]MBU4516274.1 hypothetical protein [Pseudomonadota bacterium]
MTLYDFLYIDLDRMQSLYAQLNSGLLHAMEALASTSEEKSNSGQLGGDPVGNLRHENRSAVSEASTQHISPHDIILSDVLGGLHEKGLIKDEDENLNVGNFVVLEGKVSFLNYGIGREFIDLIPIFAGSSSPDVSHLPKNERKKAIREQSKHQETGAALVSAIAKMLPWEIQMVMTTGRREAWAVIDKQKLRNSAAGLGLMYGMTLTGKWSVLGIVDQLHDEKPPRPTAFTANDMASGLCDASIGIKDLVGCPDSAIGLTPLLLFRKVG